jgi:uncharacterized protein (TIGR00369 family)
MNEMSRVLRQPERTGPRSIAVSWEDPRAAADRGRRMDGLGYMRAMQAGEISPPPIAVLLGFRPELFEPGHAVFVCDTAEYHCNPMGMVHGGVAATLIDSAAGCAIHTTLGPGEFWGTVDLNVTFVKGIAPESGAIRCEGRVIHRGRSIVTAEGRVTDADGALAAYGHITGKISRPR